MKQLKDLYDKKLQKTQEELHKKNTQSNQLDQEVLKLREELKFMQHDKIASTSGLLDKN